METLTISRLINYPAIVGVLLSAGLLLSPLRGFLEQSMVGHILIEYPLLILSGVLIGIHINHHAKRAINFFNLGGIPGIILASFSLAFWMIPRWMDASLNDPKIAIMKYCCLIFLVGIPIALSWSRLHFITKAVVKIEFLTMLLRLGWIYMISPIRLCNNYLLDQQTFLGEGFLIIGLALGIAWLLPLFFTYRFENPATPSH